jgi:LysM repeat protein
MYQISQLYGVKLSRLYKRNRMPEGSEAQPDERIKLKGICKVKESERPRLLSEPKPTNTIPVLVDEDDDFMDDDLSPDVPAPTPTKPPVITEPEDETQPTPTQPTPEGVYHTVVKGETLYGISKRYGTTVDNLLQLNNLTGTTISIGQILRVK